MRRIPLHKRLTLGASMLITGLSIMLLLAPTIVAAPHAAAPRATTSGESNDGLAYGQQTRFGKSHLVQDL